MAALIIPVHPPPVALPFIQPGHSWQVRAPAGSGLINPLGEWAHQPSRGAPLSVTAWTSSRARGNSPGESAHQPARGAAASFAAFGIPSPIPCGSLAMVEMFSAQQKMLPLVGRSLLPPVAPSLDPTKVRLLTRSMCQTAYRSLTTVSYAKTRRDLCWVEAPLRNW